MEIQNNKISDEESIEFLNMLESIEYIDISNNPIIENLDKKCLNDYFYIQKEEAKSDSLDSVKMEIKETFENYNLEDIKNDKTLSNSIRIKANNSKIIICKIH